MPNLDKNKQKDARLRKTYGITLEQYNQLLEIQKNKCAICGRPVSDFKVMNVDHQHGKIHVRRLSLRDLDFHLFPPNAKWLAVTRMRDKEYQVYGKNKAETIKQLKELILPLSVRGLLCPGRHGTGCNTKLGRADKIEFLENALKYLKNPPAWQVISPQKSA